MHTKLSPLLQKPSGVSYLEEIENSRFGQKEDKVS